ncbi:MAG: hypothetical protein AAF545_13175 [Pseudomonadota bacterium]
MLTFGAMAEGQALRRALFGWLARHGLALVRHDSDGALPGSYWGAPEAGVQGATLHVRDDTPLHSLLHEACHVVCARAAGRGDFDRNAGGDDAEEAAVCALQLLVAEDLPGLGWRKLALDMDAWGYHFIIGSTTAWFQRDTVDARLWLSRHGLTVAGCT